MNMKRAEKFWSAFFVSRRIASSEDDYLLNYVYILIHLSFKAREQKIKKKL